MLYVVAFPDGWFKLGHTSTDIWSRACHFWTNTHPPDLCGKLGPDDIRVVALFHGGYAEEQELFAQFPPQWGEFFHDSFTNVEGLLEAMSKFEPCPVPPKPEGMGFPAVEKLPCCGGQEYTCFTCGAKFPRGIKLKQHLDDVHRKVKVPCKGCGLKVIPRNLKRHQGACKKC